MNWFTDALGMAGAYAVARTIHDRDVSKRAMRQDSRAWPAAAAVALGRRPEA